MTWDIGAIEMQSTNPPLPPDPAADIIIMMKSGFQAIVRHRRKPNHKAEITVDQGVTVIVQGKQMTIYYASQAGGGSGLSQGSPFKISDFLAVAVEGDYLNVLDGTYTGTNSIK